MERLHRGTALLGILAAVSLSACTARIHERYFLSAFDPQTHITNYFRITVKGTANFGRARYSVGFYDRDAVQRLFAENTIHQEYLSTSVDVFDEETGDRLQDVSARIEAARLGRRDFRREHLVFANASVAELIGHFGTRLKLSGDYATYKDPLARAREAQQEAQGIIEGWTSEGEERFGEIRKMISGALKVLAVQGKPEDLATAGKAELEGYAAKLSGAPTKAKSILEVAVTALEKKDVKAAQDNLKVADKILAEASARHVDIATAMADLREAQAILEIVRIAVDGDVLVRFFSGDGLEIDVTSKTLVVFVANDISRFSEALRQLAKGEEASRDLILTVMGPRIQEAQRLAAEVADSTQDETALDKRLLDLVGALEKEAAGMTDNAAKVKRIEAVLLEIAAATAGRGASFKSAQEIRAYVAGRRDR